MMSYYAAPGQQQPQQQQQYPMMQQQYSVPQQQQAMYGAPSVYAQPIYQQQPSVLQQQPRPVSPVVQQQPQSVLQQQPRPVSPVLQQQPRSVSPVAEVMHHPSADILHHTPSAGVTTAAPTSVAQVNAISTLRQRITAESAAYPADVMSYCNDGCLSRYLRAREWDIEAAFKMLKASLDWRATYKPHLISASQIQGPLNVGTMFNSGFDRQNRPVLYVKPGAHSPNTIDERIMYVVWLMEHVASIMAENVEQVLIIMDFSEFGKRAKSPDSRQTAQSIINILQNHYPERLGSAIVINSPWYFNLLFKMMSPFINANTKKKMAWITGDSNQIFQILSQSVDPSQLLTLYGGKNGNYPAGEAHN